MLKVDWPIWKRCSLGCCEALPLKVAHLFPRSQQTASIVLTIIGHIGYLDIGAIFMHAVFPFAAKEEKIEFFDSRKKPRDVCWGKVLSWDAFFTG